MAEPMLAPALSDGAKMPPDVPAVNEKIKPLMRKKGVYQCTILSSVNSVRVIRSLPEPKASSPKKNPEVATITAQSKMYKIMDRVTLNALMRFNSDSIMALMMLPDKPANTATTITPKNTVAPKFPSFG